MEVRGCALELQSYKDYLNALIKLSDCDTRGATGRGAHLRGTNGETNRKEMGRRRTPAAGSAERPT